MPTINSKSMLDAMGKSRKDGDEQKADIEREQRNDNNFINKHILDKPKRQLQTKAVWMKN